MSDDIVERLRRYEKQLNDGLSEALYLGEAADTIEQLQAQVEALQNKCAHRGLSLEDSDRLQSRNEQLEELLREMLQWCEAYPEHIFTPLQGDPIKKTGDYDTEEKCTLITRASASMGRHILKKWPEKIREALET